MAALDREEEADLRRTVAGEHGHHEVFWLRQSRSDYRLRTSYSINWRA